MPQAPRHWRSGLGLSFSGSWQARLSFSIRKLGSNGSLHVLHLMSRPGLARLDPACGVFAFHPEATTRDRFGIGTGHLRRNWHSTLDAINWTSDHFHNYCSPGCGARMVSCAPVADRRQSLWAALDGRQPDIKLPAWPTNESVYTNCEHALSGKFHPSKGQAGLAIRREESRWRHRRRAHRTGFR